MFHLFRPYVFAVFGEPTKAFIKQPNIPEAN